MSRTLIFSWSTGCIMAAVLGLCATPAVAGKNLPKDLAAYLQEQESTLPGLTEAVSEHFINTEYSDGISCDKAWSKSAKKAPNTRALVKAYARTKCLVYPFGEYLSARKKEVTESVDISECTAAYAPASVEVPDGRRPSDPADAHTWAHIPAEAMRTAIESSEEGAKASWGKCVEAINSARDAYTPVHAWFAGVGLNVPPACPKSARLNADISQPVEKITKQIVQACHFGTAGLSLAYQYQKAHASNGELNKRVQTVESAFEKSIAKRVASCPTKDDEEYAHITNDAMSWDVKSIGSAVKWSGSVLKYCKALSQYPGDLPEVFHPMVDAHADAIAAAAALTEEVEARLPAIKEKKDVLYEAEAEAVAKLEALCEKLGTRAESLELAWKKCMSNADLSSTARQYSVTDQELYQAHMEKKAISCAKSSGMASALTKFLQQCEESDCGYEELYEIDPYEGDYGELHVCDLLYPDKGTW
jgi:hypothetical protein